MSSMLDQNRHGALQCRPRLLWADRLDETPRLQVSAWRVCPSRTTGNAERAWAREVAAEVVDLWKARGGLSNRRRGGLQAGGEHVGEA